MATKRFDDVAEKARALEAQAKKLRREAQAARTKAYADALVAVFPEVKDMGSAEEVLDFVKGLKPSTGHGTPDARAAGAADSGHFPTAEAGESSEAHGGFSGAAAPSQADGVGQIARIAICTYEVNACSFPLCAETL